MNKTIRKVKSPQRRSNIFCIEGSWENDHRDTKSVIKALEFLKCIEKVDCIVKQCNNVSTLNDLLNDSMLAKYKKYSILYLAFHGKPNNILVGKRNSKTNLEEIAEMIGDKANGKIIHFGSCSTLNISGWELRKFLKKTNALAISGYKEEVDFVKSTVFDLIYFQQCQKSFDIRVIEKNINKYYSTLGKE
ncbi:MAG: hypothetical protein IPI22_13640 [Bacteroidetes bacterium]|nr:hypothetical protein [Bacteroidota bacterium]